ncbi:MAG: trehalose operon repressor [Clostridia bacterium]|nr:trehalose operon repressor [Clostridia bacterium]
MPKSKYEIIYLKLKQRIEALEYEYQDLLPSENTLVQEFECSRNTIRRAIQTLAADGYVQSLHGKGVRIIYQPNQHSQFLLNGIESFSEACKRNSIPQYTKVILFSEQVVDEKLSHKTGLQEGKEIYYIQRVRYIDHIPLIVDHNYFLKDIVSHLTKEIAEQSIYDYLENHLGVSITTTKRVITVEPATENDETNLELHGCNCVAVVSGMTYNADGVMFEYTQSRHSPSRFEFHEVAQRRSAPSLTIKTMNKSL